MKKQFFKWDYLKRNYKDLLEPNEEGDTLLKLILLQATKLSGSDSTYLFIYYFNPTETLFKIDKIKDSEECEIKLAIHPSWFSDEGIDILEKIGEQTRKDLFYGRSYIDYTAVDYALFYIYALRNEYGKILEISNKVEKKNDFFHRNTFADKNLNILDSLSSLLQARHVYHERTRDEKTKSCVSLGYSAYAYMKTINFYKSITPKDILQLTQFVGIVDDITKAISTLDSYSETLESGVIKKQISDLKEACVKEYQKMILNITSCLTKKSKYVSRKIDSIITDSVEAAIASYGANITFEALMNNKWNTQAPIIEYLNKNDDGLEMFVNYLGSLAKNSKMKEAKKKMIIQCNHDYMMSLLRSDESVKKDSDLLAVILKKNIAELFPYIL